MMSTVTQMMKPAIAFEEFGKIAFRVGTIIHAEDFPKARNPSYKVRVDFGDKIMQSSAQLPFNYPQLDALFQKQVISITNMPSRKIAGFKSEILIVGFPDENGHVHLLNTRGRNVSKGIGLCTDEEGTPKLQIQYETFQKADIRAATVSSLKPLETDPNSYCATLDLGEALGQKTSTIVDIDESIAKELEGSQVAVMINLKRECKHDPDNFVLAFKQDDKRIPFGIDQTVNNGVQLF